MATRRLVWLPDEDWAVDVDVPAELDVAVWRGGQRLPDSVAEVSFYVPEYLGDASTVQAIARMPALRVVQTLTAGVDHVAAVVPPHVTLCNAAGVHDASTAELAVGLTIAALRGFVGFGRAQDQGRWQHEFRPALADRRVVVVGWGAVGQAIGRRLAPFEVEVIPVAATARSGVRGVDDLGSVLPGADVVVIAVPLTERTRGLVGAGFLAAMADGSLLVNVARGQVVDTDALVAELITGRLSAALDVTDPEPLPPDHPLWRAPNVLITPHVGGNTTAFRPRATRLLTAQLRRFVSGQPLANVITSPGGTS
jgi:phosphoglycerate dehydrogenase-like enzyme